MEEPENPSGNELPAGQEKPDPTRISGPDTVIISPQRNQDRTR